MSSRTAQLSWKSFRMSRYGFKKKKAVMNPLCCACLPVFADESCCDAQCTNTPGSYICGCGPGYSCNGTLCIDLDECNLMADNCSEHARYCTMADYCSEHADCTNTVGSYSCQCSAGYSGNGRTCVDINECSLYIYFRQCPQRCVNTQGSFRCECYFGYTGNGTYCQDIDECGMGIHQCDSNAVCRNQGSSYRCSCIPGYSGSGRVCDDIDECRESTVVIDVFFCNNFSVFPTKGFSRPGTQVRRFERTSIGHNLNALDDSLCKISMPIF